MIFNDFEFTLDDDLNNSSGGPNSEHTTSVVIPIKRELPSTLEVFEDHTTMHNIPTITPLPGSQQQTSVCTSQSALNGNGTLTSFCKILFLN